MGRSRQRAPHGAWLWPGQEPEPASRSEATAWRKVSGRQTLLFLLRASLRHKMTSSRLQLWNRKGFLVGTWTNQVQTASAFHVAVSVPWVGFSRDCDEATQHCNSKSWWKNQNDPLCWFVFKNVSGRKKILFLTRIEECGVAALVCIGIYNPRWRLLSLWLQKFWDFDTSFSWQWTQNEHSCQCKNNLPHDFPKCLRKNQCLTVNRREIFEKLCRICSHHNCLWTFSNLLKWRSHWSNSLCVDLFYSSKKSQPAFPSLLLRGSSWSSAWLLAKCTRCLWYCGSPPMQPGIARSANCSVAVNSSILELQVMFDPQTAPGQVCQLDPICNVISVKYLKNHKKGFMTPVYHLNCVLNSISRWQNFV